jgi:hypothetical protein
MGDSIWPERLVLPRCCQEDPDYLRREIERRAEAGEDMTRPDGITSLIIELRLKEMEEDMHEPNEPSPTVLTRRRNLDQVTPKRGAVSDRRPKRVRHRSERMTERISQLEQQVQELLEWKERVITFMCRAQVDLHNAAHTSLLWNYGHCVYCDQEEEWGGRVAILPP